MHGHLWRKHAAQPGGGLTSEPPNRDAMHDRASLRRSRNTLDGAPGAGPVSVRAIGPGAVHRFASIALDRRDPVQRFAVRRIEDGDDATSADADALPHADPATADGERDDEGLGP